MTVQQNVNLVPVTKDDHVFGHDDAPLTLIEYGDFQCVYCGEAYPVVKKLEDEFPMSLRFVFRNMPLSSVHPDAELAAEFAECAALQGRYWSMHDELFEHQDDLSREALLRYSESAGLNVDLVLEELDRADVAEHVARDVEGALRSGVDGTPTYFVNDRLYGGPRDYEAMRDYFNSLLEELAEASTRS